MPKVVVLVLSLFAAGALALAGCSSDSDTDSVPTASSLVGSWSASQVGYGNGELEGPYPSTFVIQKADNKSRSFTGVRVVSPADAKKFGIPAQKVRIDGVITTWGEISIVHSDGTWTLEMDGDEMVGRYLENGSDLAAKSLTLKRQR